MSVLLPRSLVVIGRHFALVDACSTVEELSLLAGERGASVVQLVQRMLAQYAEAQALLEAASGSSELPLGCQQLLFDCFEKIWAEVGKVDEGGRGSTFWKVVEFDFHHKVVFTFEGVLKRLDRSTLFRALLEASRGVVGRGEGAVLQWELCLKLAMEEPHSVPRLTAVLKGLQAEPALNGQEVEVLGLVWARDQPRVEVQLRAHPHGAKRLSVKPERLVFSRGTGMLELNVCKYKQSLAYLEAAVATEKVEVFLRDVRPAFSECRGLLLYALKAESDGGEPSHGHSEPLAQLVEDYARAVTTTAEAIVECSRYGCSKAALLPAGLVPAGREVQERRKQLQLVFHPDKLRQLGVPPFDQAHLPETFLEVQHVIASVFSGACHQAVSHDHKAFMERGLELAKSVQVFAEAAARCQQQEDAVGARVAGLQKESHARRAVEEFRVAMLALDRMSRDGGSSQVTSMARARVRVSIAEMCEQQNRGTQAALYLLAALRVLRSADMSTPEARELTMAIYKVSGADLGTRASQRVDPVEGQRAGLAGQLALRAPSSLSNLQVQELSCHLEGRALACSLAPTRPLVRRADERARLLRQVQLQSGGAFVSCAKAAAASWLVPHLAVPLGGLYAALFMRALWLERVGCVQESVTQHLLVAMACFGHGSDAGQLFLESLATQCSEMGRPVLTYPLEHDIIGDVTASMRWLLEWGVPPSLVMCVFAKVAETLACCQVSTMRIGERTVTPTRSNLKKAGQKLYLELVHNQAGMFRRAAKSFDAKLQNDTELTMRDETIALSLRKKGFPYIQSFLREHKVWFWQSRRLEVTAVPPQGVLRYNFALDPSQFRKPRYVERVQTLGQDCQAKSWPCTSLDELLAVVQGQEEVKLLLKADVVTRWTHFAAIARVIFGIEPSLASEGAEMRSVQRQHLLARLDLGVVFLLEAASVADSGNKGDVEAAEVELQAAAAELKAMSDGQDCELESKLEAVGDFMETIMCREADFGGGREAHARASAVLVTDTGRQCLEEQFAELWSGDDDFATLDLAFQMSGHSCLARAAMAEVVQQLRSSSPARQQVMTAQPGAAGGGLDGRRAALSMGEAILLVERSNAAVCLWEWGEDGTLQPEDSTERSKPVHLCAKSGRLFAVKLLPRGQPGAARLLASLKSGKYDDLPVKARIVAALTACAEDCASKRLAAAEDQEVWAAREVGWLQCAVGAMKLRKCEQMDLAPVIALLKLLADKGQHRVIVDDTLSDPGFALRFAGDQVGRLQLWHAYGQLCLGSRTLAKATCNVARASFELRAGSPQGAWAQRMLEACESPKRGPWEGLLTPPRDPPERRRKHILSLVGDGLHCVLPARVLVELEQRLHCPVAHLFSAVTGASTSSALIAGLCSPHVAQVGAADGHARPRLSASEALDLYVQSDLALQKGRQGKLRNLLQRAAGDGLYKDLLSEVFLPYALDQQTRVFTRSGASRDLKVFDAVCAASAATVPALAHGIILNGEEGVLLNEQATDAPVMALDHVRRTFPDAKVSLLSLGTGSGGIYPKSSPDELWWEGSTDATDPRGASTHCELLMQSRRSDSFDYIYWKPTMSHSAGQPTQDLLSASEHAIECAYAAEDNWFNKLLESLSDSKDVVAEYAG